MNNETLHNLDAEQLILGAMMCNKAAIRRVQDILKPEHFASAGHQIICETIYKLHSENGQANPVTVAAKLPAIMPELPEETRDYLASMVVASVSVIEPKSYAEVIREFYGKRVLSNLCADYHLMISTTPDATCAEIAVKISQEAQSVFLDAESSRFRTGEQVVDDILHNLKDDFQCFSTGIPALDDARGGGLLSGKAYGFMARMKMGKTILAGTISHALMVQKTPHLFVAGEMGQNEIHQRILAREMGEYEGAFRNPVRRNSPDFWTKISDTKKRLDMQKLIYRSDPQLTFSRLRDYVAIARDKYGIKVVILDYWQLVGGKENRKSEAEHLAEVAQWIAANAKETGIAWVVMGQMNQYGNVRGSEGVRLAFDQVYKIEGNNDDRDDPYRWFDMMETRYTGWSSVGTKDNPIIRINPLGLFFEQP